MADRESYRCKRCGGLAVTLADRGLTHWLRFDGPHLHYLASTDAADRLAALWNAGKRYKVNHLFTRIDAVDAGGMVAWVDIEGDEEFILFRAAHGEIPAEIPRPSA